MIRTTGTLPTIRQATRRLLGLKCWYASCGSVGSSFQLALGKKIRRITPLRNRFHSSEYRKNEGEANLLVWCDWRLDDPHEPLTSSDDTGEGIERGLNRLVGAIVEKATVQSPAWDLSVSFSNRLALRVFCDHIAGAPSFDGNWEIAFTDASLYVGPGARIVAEPRSASD